MCNTGLPTPFGKQVQFRKTDFSQIAIFPDRYIIVFHSTDGSHFSLQSGPMEGNNYYLLNPVSTPSEFMASFHECSVKAFNLAQALELLFENVLITDAGT